MYHLLQPYPARVIAVVWIATSSGTAQKRLLRYHTEWRFVEPELTGDDLKEMGLEPGPLFGHLLRKLRDARLNGEASTRGEEMALVEQVLADEEG
jgi:tRNA nucleotidyltransferase (CCA-adding enzyme)